MKRLQQFVVAHGLLLVLFVLPQVAVAYDFMVDGLAYEINSDGRSVMVTFETDPFASIGHVAYESAEGPLTIPETVTYGGNIYSVTAIGDGAFCGCSFTGNITIPASVTAIGNLAFYYCYDLTGSLSFPEGVTTIGEYAFYGCAGFDGALTLPESVTAIGGSAFYDCSGFTAIYNHISHPSKVQLGDEVFAECNYQACTLYVPSKSIAAYRTAAQWKNFVNIRCGSWEADLNGDGNVDVSDVSLLIDIILGKQ